MKWIQPMDRYKKAPVRCEFCGSDVSTPYKGIHDGIEMINGFPSPCRNNGRRNIDIWNPLKTEIKK